MKITEEFDKQSNKIGTFVILLVTLGLAFIVILLLAGVNPTLVISIVSAPMWVGIIILCLKLTKKIRGK
tara:strand:- start:2109 stop:2315 length:207 start_codon:yes stop_codon:yes gene_type:complete